MATVRRSRRGDHAADAAGRWDDDHERHGEHGQHGIDDERRSWFADPRIFVPLMVPVALIAILLVAWSVDSALNRGTVTRNVSVLGTDVGGLDRAQLEVRLAELALGYADTPVTIATTGGDLTTTAGVVGIQLDAEATADQVMDMGRGSIITRPFRWMGSLFGTDTAPVSVELGDGDPAALATLVNDGQPEPVEPTLAVTDGEVVVVPGEPALEFDVDEIRADALAAAAAGVDPIAVEAGSVEILPATGDDVAQGWADDVNAATAGPLNVGAGGRRDDLDAATIRSWIVFDPATRPPTWDLDDDLVNATLEERFSAITGGDVEENPTIVVVDGELKVDSLAAKVCCAPGSAARIRDALLAGEERVRLQLEDADEVQQRILSDLGIIELVSEATTPHDCCATRVVNIHRFADLMTGVIVQPGDSLSLNDHVGQRTIEKGFVESGVIYLGELSTDVGGGVSQFATTFFQAAFYGGYDIDEYFPHTLWFDRYADREGRRGIESTISFPEPDVQITNNTPYPVLVWPTYTETSLTVSFYSTSYVEADVAEQREFASGQCTVIETDRERLFPDGTREIDTFRATYQPADGIGCDGQPTNPDSVTPTPVPERPDRPNRPNRPNRPTATPVPEPEPEPTEEPAPEPTAEPAPEPTVDPGA